MVNNTENALAPHVTYIVLFVNKHIRKKEIITLYYDQRWEREKLREKQIS